MGKLEGKVAVITGTIGHGASHGEAVRARDWKRLALMELGTWLVNDPYGASAST